MIYENSESDLYSGQPLLNVKNRYLTPSEAVLKHTRWWGEGGWGGYSGQLVLQQVVPSRDGVKYMKYLYLKYLNTFFKVIESISNTLRKKVFVFAFVFKYITKVFEISNTFKYI